jgi:hypothetical protein
MHGTFMRTQTLMSFCSQSNTPASVPTFSAGGMLPFSLFVAVASIAHTFSKTIFCPDIDTSIVSPRPHPRWASASLGREIRIASLGLFPDTIFILFRSGSNLAMLYSYHGKYINIAIQS